MICPLPNKYIDYDVHPMSRTFWVFDILIRQILSYIVFALPLGSIGQRWGASWAPLWVYTGDGVVKRRRFFFIQTQQPSSGKPKR